MSARANKGMKLAPRDRRFSDRAAVDLVLASAGGGAAQLMPQPLGS